MLSKCDKKVGQRNSILFTMSTLYKMLCTTFKQIKIVVRVDSDADKQSNRRRPMQFSQFLCDVVYTQFVHIQRQSCLLCSLITIAAGSTYTLLIQ